MANDFYTNAAAARASQIEAELAAAKADLAAHRANADVESAAMSVQSIANLEAEKANLTSLYQNYVASQQPPQPPELSQEEKHAKPFNRMDYNDALELAQTSKYGKKLTHDDPAVQAGYREVQRRRARGE